MIGGRVPDHVTRLTTQQVVRLLFPSGVADEARRAITDADPADEPRMLSVRPETEERCRVLLERLRWPDGVRCPRCETATGISTIEDRAQFECGGCGYQFSVRVGTVFHGSHLPLWKWVLAVHLMTGSAEGVSANQLRRTLGISYKTAWHLMHRIRAAMTEEGADGDHGDRGAVVARSSRTLGRVTHLSAYLDEKAFRTKNRGNPYLLVEMLSRLIGIGSVPYARLIASA